jgi:hypothetical protein
MRGDRSGALAQRGAVLLKPIRAARAAALEREDAMHHFPRAPRRRIDSVRGALCALLALSFNSAAAVAAPADSSDVASLTRKVDVLTQEIETMRMGGAAAPAELASRHGMAPAAAKVYGVQSGVSIGGYGEMLLQSFDANREDDLRSGKLPRIDLLRTILYVGHKFSDELLFNSEIEIEHAGTGEAPLGGEVSVEFAYLDWSRDPRFGVRAGMVLAPLGLVNEMHEPPVFIGARRSDVESAIIPTTWRVNGAGIYGEFPSGFSYRAYLTEGLDAREFTASAPIRGGRQKGSEARATKPALSARADFSGVPGLVVGGGAYRGNSWQDHQPDSLRLSPVTTLVEGHATFQRNGFLGRALYAYGMHDDAALLSDALNLTGMNRLGESFHGFYVEGEYDVMPILSPGSRYGLAPYARFEKLDTQESVPGGSENPANEHTVLTFGAAFRPHPNAVLKAERQQRSNEAETATSQWNIQIGYLF